MLIQLASEEYRASLGPADTTKQTRMYAKEIVKATKIIIIIIMLPTPATLKKKKATPFVMSQEVGLAMINQLSSTGRSDQFWNQTTPTLKKQVATKDH